MLTNLDFIEVIQAPNGPFAFCCLCATVVAANPHKTGKPHLVTSTQSLLYRHLKQHHPIDPTTFPDLLAVRPELITALENSRYQLPHPLPDGHPQIDGLKV
jgi:hypothetical protein